MSADSFDFRVLQSIHEAAFRRAPITYLFVGRKEWGELGSWLGAQTAAGAMAACERRPDGTYFRGLLVLEVDREEFLRVA